MPLPEPSEQEGESVPAGQKPNPKHPQLGMSEEFELVLVTVSHEDSHGVSGVGAQPESVHYGVSLGDPQILLEQQGGALQPSPPALELQGNKPDPAPWALCSAAPKPLEFLRTPFGGRLLVLETFLYKQEKAMGDKVYWKCRQHATLRCRGRAITRGGRATIMHEHCHPPDEEALEARRQKQRRRGLALAEDPDPLAVPVKRPDPQTFRPLSLLNLPPKKRPRLWTSLRPGLEFLSTCYGGTFLVHQSFLYKREKTVGDRSYWTCRDHTLHCCRGRAITQGQRVTVMRGHCHPPDVEALEARRLQERVGDTQRATRRGLSDSLLCQTEPGVPSLNRRPRKQARPKPLQEPPSDDQDDQDEEPGPEFLKTPLGGSFLVFESFLYRREKAAGDKVYWTCRDQARMGCRSRAITQGQQVTVMRGHCHPPDLGGLETLRQRENRPDATPRESPGGTWAVGWGGSRGPVVTPPSALPTPILEGVTAPSPHFPIWVFRAHVPLQTAGTKEGPEFLKTPLGGSFLVFESFLYRREKAAGDKVYWTCRDQARMRCRSRAITQGQRVMVMRRHCHPPDLGGLEAMRQRENFPRLAQREDSETFQPLEFLRTSLGGRFLVFESFLYRKEKAAGDKVYWMCRDQARLGCRSRAITQGQQVTVMRDHCHQPDLAGLEALRQRDRLPIEAQLGDPGCQTTRSSERDARRVRPSRCSDLPLPLPKHPKPHASRALPGGRLSVTSGKGRSTQLGSDSGRTPASAWHPDSAPLWSAMSRRPLCFLPTELPCVLPAARGVSGWGSVPVPWLDPPVWFPASTDWLYTIPSQASGWAQVVSWVICLRIQIHCGTEPALRVWRRATPPALSP
ncbi:FLYWCH-type zinc finger-containing protein 1 isoform X2 [Erinaceus europaeus]|uniref:FLYWCH-type zinc finger-containing protein 1 isoform X2 n=1 Tax=Erinaceus europaeus TaxID=9365 RepID=A0ABM3VWG5_ERIEU|nr:FLYWCH-type zinc finger-containing protein 1 isoform X2 [Erinaceus europaeus]